MISEAIMSLFPLLITLAVISMVIRLMLSLSWEDRPHEPPKPVKVKVVKVRSGWGKKTVTCPSCGAPMKVPKKPPFGHASEPVDCESCHASFRPYMVVGQ